jgi:serine/threonine protein kinase
MQPLSDDTSGLLTNLERVDELCLRFENDWLAGRRPRVEEYLAGLSEEFAHQLLAELLLLEWDYRSRAGETVNREEYTKRFSNQQRTVEEAWRSLKVQNRRGERTVARCTAPSAVSIDKRAEFSLPGHEEVTRIGKGGMGEVYKAWDTQLKRWIALKQVRLEHSTPAHVARFRREAEALARLTHPRIVTVHGFVENDGKPVLVMEYLAGGSLEERLCRQALAPAEAARLVALLAWGVQAAHEAGVVHRDLKPANVLMDHPKAGDPGNVLGGYPKISDFGLAALAESRNGECATTLEGAVLGTPAYMSPEQAAGRTREVGPAADVWALGVILYRCLTGKLPFEGDSVLDTLERIKTMQIQPLRELFPEVPADLESICLACLRKAPGDRPTAAGLARQLEATLRGDPVQSTPREHRTSVPGTDVPARPRNRWLLTARRRWLLSAACAALAGVVFLATEMTNRTLIHHRDASAPPAAPMSMLEVLALSENLKSNDKETRARAAVALGKAGKEARIALPKLLNALRDNDEKIRELVAHALDRIGPPAKEDLPILSMALREDDPDIRAYAVSALDELREAAWDEIEQVRAMTADPDPQVRAAAEKTRALMEKDMLESLRHWLKDPNPEIRSEAAERMSDLGRASPEVVRKAAVSLMAALTDDNEAVRVAASRSLSNFGTRVVPMLAEALRNRNKVARRMAVASLANLGPDAIGAVRDLAGVVDDPDVGEAAAVALANNLGDLAVPGIAAALVSPTSGQNRRGVLESLLIRIGPSGLPALHSYIKRYPAARARFDSVLSQLKALPPAPFARTVPSDPITLAYYRECVNRFRAWEDQEHQELNLEKAQVGLKMDANAFRALVKRMDRDGNGRISRAEYERWSIDHATRLAKEYQVRKALLAAQKVLHESIARFTSDSEKYVAAIVKEMTSDPAKQAEQRAAAETQLRRMERKARNQIARAYQEVLDRQNALAKTQPLAGPDALAVLTLPVPLQPKKPVTTKPRIRRPTVHRAAPSSGTARNGPAPPPKRRK